MRTHPEPELESSSVEVYEADVGATQVCAPSFGEPVDNCRFMAPEAFNPESRFVPYSQGINVYSFAMVAFVALTSSVPFNDRADDEALKVEILRDKLRPTLPADVDAILERVMRRCWDEDPQRRPTFTEIDEALSPSHEFPFPFFVPLLLLLIVTLLTLT